MHLSAFCLGKESYAHRSIVIPTGCFNFCRNLSSINIPSSVTSLGDQCFYYCSKLKSVDIPSSVTSLGNCCFSDYSGLKSINIPSSVTSLGKYCFESCSKLDSFSCHAITSPECGLNCFKSCDTLVCKLHVPQESIDQYKAANGWKGFLNIYALGGSGESTHMNSALTPSIVVSCNNGIITISGLNAQENVTFYTLTGEQLGRAAAVDGTAKFAVKASGDIVIAKFGGSSMKIATK